MKNSESTEIEGIIRYFKLKGNDIPGSSVQVNYAVCPPL